MASGQSGKTRGITLKAQVGEEMLVIGFWLPIYEEVTRNRSVSRDSWTSGSGLEGVSEGRIVCWIQDRVLRSLAKCIRLESFHLVKSDQVASRFSRLQLVYQLSSPIIRLPVDFFTTRREDLNPRTFVVQGQKAPIQSFNHSIFEISFIPHHVNIDACR